MRTKLKKLTSVCLAVIMILSVLTVAPFTVGAAETNSESVGDTYTSGDFSYMVLDDGTASITHYNGNDTDLTIPSTLDGYTMTEIGWYAFSGCASLVSVTIPNSVTKIGDSAFRDCTSLESITIPNSVTEIGYGAFEYCTSLTSIAIPDSITEINKHSFNNCTSMTEINISNNNPNYCSIDGIVYNKDITELIICPDGKTETIIPDSVTKIGEYAFSHCTGITSVTIPGSVIIIDHGAFEGCKSLTSIIIPDSVTNICWEAFSYCTSLEIITIPDSVTEIGCGAFQGCARLESITIPDSVMEIESYAFEDTAWYDNQPDGVVYAGKFAYKYKGEMPENTSITLIDGTKGIVDFAFRYCTGLIEITIPDSVTKIGSGAFYDTKWYDDQPDGVVYVGKFVYGYKGEIPENTSVVLKDGTKGMTDFTFEDCQNIQNITSFTIPDSVISISTGAFENCTGLTKITIPDSVKEIGSSAFRYCKNLESIIIPDSVTKIGECAFYDCTSLESITIPDSVKKIGASAFEDCISLANVTIPDSVINIEHNAFGYVYDYVDYIYRKIEGFTIYGYTGTAAEMYANKNGFAFIPINQHTDTDSNITVLAGTNAELKVAEITDTDEIEQVNLKLENEKVESLYDISFVKNGATVQPDGTATVKIPCTNQNSKVYRVETDESLTDMNAVYDNGYMVFSTNHFSLYVLTSEKADVMLGDVDGDGKVSIDDVTDIQKCIANTIKFTEEQMSLADVDKNGKVTIDDVTLIQKHLAGMVEI